MSLCMAEKTRVKKENSMDNAGIFFSLINCPMLEDRIKCKKGGNLKMELRLPKPGSHCASLIESDALHHCPIHFLETFFFSQKAIFALICKVLTNLSIGIQWYPCLQKVNVFLLFFESGSHVPEVGLK